MKVVLAPDSFKESMTAAEAAAAMTRGVRQVLSDAVCVELPMADGGEGTTAALVAALDGRLLPVDTVDARGRPHRGRIGLTDDGLAVVEVAEAVGIELIPPAQRDVLHATSAGVADLVRAGLDAGATRMIVGLGGSATNDGGAGLLSGLGARLLDAAGSVVGPVPDQLDRVAAIDLTGLDPRLAQVDIELACDVTNPLLGPTGATAVFGPQKGVAADQVDRLDHSLSVLADALEAATGRPVRDQPGAGAAGGLGAALLALGARRRRGIDVVIDAAGLREQLADADLVLTGEGGIDEQTLAGKTPAGVAQAAHEVGVPVIAFAGRVAPSADVLLDHGFAAIVPILRRLEEPADALLGGADNLQHAVATTMRLLRLARDHQLP